ncbi:hypothetical protein ACH5RR_022872 [Cinchona calisaya]|uniref:Uncharacterized protein n=1 Tax=Cinchona calisaya TaxID=153742 RepID=A0ABD2ZCG0_9GENT
MIRCLLYWLQGFYSFEGFATGISKWTTNINVDRESPKAQAYPMVDLAKEASHDNRVKDPQKKAFQEKQWQPKGLLLCNDTVKALEKGNPSGISIMEKNATPIYVADKPVVSKSDNALEETTNSVPDQPATSKIDEHEQGMADLGKLKISSNMEHVVLLHIRNLASQMLSLSLHGATSYKRGCGGGLMFRWSRTSEV